ncbi:hypothetical protein GCM10027051_19070 [Niabella terrae]
MTRIPDSLLQELTQPYELPAAAIAFYQENRYIKLKEVLSAAVLDYFNQAITDQVARMNTITSDLGQRDTYGKAFLQLFNLWRVNEDAKALVFSERLGRIATQLMQVEGVRIYHDQALFKESGGGITPWHADQYYWPLSTDKTITAWIPLQATPLEMGPLEFSAASHQIVEGRELAIGDESEHLIRQRLKVTDFNHVIEAFDPGEISFHSGWIFHRAGANSTGSVRKVMTVIYMDRDMKLKAPENENQQNDWDTWCPGAEVDQIIASPLNPVIYENPRS